MSGVAYELDLTTGVLIWGEELYAVFGYDRSDLADSIDWWTDHIHHDDAMILNQAMDALLTPGAQGWTVEYRFAKADNNYVLVQDRAVVVRDDKGLPLRLKGTLTPKT
jgi:PAS domain-containing protein